jgi:hypothetical protein
MITIERAADKSDADERDYDLANTYNVYCLQQKKLQSEPLNTLHCKTTVKKNKGNFMGTT